MVLIYTTLLNDIAKPTIILWVIVLILMLALYISYVYFTRVQKPLYLSRINYDAYQTQNYANQTLNNGTKTTGNANKNNIKKTTTNSGKKITPKIDFTQLQQFANLQPCPQGECAIKTSGNLIGVKRCPATSDGVIMYDTAKEECVPSNECPSDIPYAQQLNGEALTSICGTGNDGCNCLAQPQCATYVSKYFNNVGLGNYGEGSEGLNYAFSIEGQKPSSNFYNPLQIDFSDLGKVFCKINPAFVDTIINGCELTNHWTDPTNCQNYQNVIFQGNDNLIITVQQPNSVYDYFNESEIPRDISNSTYFQNANSLAVIVSGLKTDPPQELPFIGYFTKSTNGTSLFRYNDYVKAIISIEKGENFYVLKNVNYYDGSDFLPGTNNYLTANDELTFNYFDYTFCNDSAVNGANNKSMLMCVQDKNQPCTSGTLAYNYDRTITASNNARNFCQAYDQPGVDRLAINSSAEASIQTFYLTDPAYFTQSCVVGYGCGDRIDFTQCNPQTNDCTVAIREKKNRFFPIFDDSAISNVWQVGPNYVQLNNYGTSMISLSSYSVQGAFYLKNNLFDLENGDYFQINNRPVNDIFLMKKATVGSDNLILNTTEGLNVGDTLLNPLIDGEAVSIDTISGNEITISNTVSAGVSSLFASGTHLIFNATVKQNEYGIIRNIGNNDIRKPFLLLDLETLTSQNITQEQIDNKGIIFYKQFGFNGLNYGTCYNTTTFEREFSNSYQYGTLNNFINPVLRKATKPPFIVDNLIAIDTNSTTDTTKLHKQVFTSTDANFKQKNSMYYPVWNEDTFKQECVFCSPSLYALPNISNDGKLEAVSIQFSGKDFYQYTKDINSQIFKEAGGELPAPEYFMYTMYSLTSTKKNEPSTPAVIYLQNPNLDVQVGDFVIDASGIISVKIIDSNSNNVSSTINKSNLNTFEEVFSDEIASSKPALLPSDLTTSIYNQIKLTPNSGKNLFAGKKYYLINSAPGATFYLVVPVIQVASIGQSGRAIFTDSSSTNVIPKNTFLQFIRPTSIIGLDLQGDINAISTSTSYANQPVYAGASAQIFVDEITDGRITNIKVDKQGVNYVPTNKPLLYVNEYKMNSNILIRS